MPSGLSRRMVHVWQVPLAQPEDRINSSRALLSQEELDRAHRFYFDHHRVRFIAGRAALKSILSGYLEINPRSVEFSLGPQGKPELKAGMAESGIRFNLSHSGDFALVAVTQGLAVGVDIEAVNREFAGEDIARRFFSPDEVARLVALPSGERIAAFFRCWTRKEAYIKALGKGLSLPLDSFDVTFEPGVSALLLRSTESEDEPSRWSMYDLAVPEGYTGALVVEGREHSLEQRMWQF